MGPGSTRGGASFGLATAAVRLQYVSRLVLGLWASFFPSQSYIRFLQSSYCGQLVDLPGSRVGVSVQKLDEGKKKAGCGVWFDGRLVGGLSGSRESERAYVHDAGHACSNAGVVLSPPEGTIRGVGM